MSFGNIDPPPTLRRSRQGSKIVSPLVVVVTGLGWVLLFVIVRSLLRHGLEHKGCKMSYMRPSYVHLTDFGNEHTRFATKYSLYLYREQGIDDEQLRGIPVLFIPGNAGSYKQVRPIAAEAASYHHNILLDRRNSMQPGVRNLDFFTVDFNEDITAFHGQTLLDQAEYLNEAVRYILSLYSDPQRAGRDDEIPDPSAVVILGHSMGGVVARAMLTQPNYQSKSINSIITMAAPHARPPVTFDAQIVHIYDEINGYWRRAYAQKWANDNPLWHVTLVSIAGGSLDTVVPSDYASLESIVPETHGFTVFTSGIPNVWTSMDHQAILWCDQFRKVVARALYDIVDATRASQTKPRADRMRLLKRRFLPGMEIDAEKVATFRHGSIPLSTTDDSSKFVLAGPRLSLGTQTEEFTPTSYLIPVPPPDLLGTKRFTFITDASLDLNAAKAGLQVLLCSVIPNALDSDGVRSPRHLGLAAGRTSFESLSCKSSAPDAIFLPAQSRPADAGDAQSQAQPYTYLHYGPEHLTDHQFIVVRVLSELSAFVLAEFSDAQDFQIKHNATLAQLLTEGLVFDLQPDRPLVVDVSIMSAASALLAFKLEISNSRCSGKRKMPTLIRQFLNKPYESKYFINTRQVSVSLHGKAPFLPPPLETAREVGLTLQIWSDPICESPLTARLRLDVWASFGKLYMRYRTIIAAFPLLVEAMVLRKQIRVYDEAGIFMSFSQGLDQSLRRSIPLLLACLTLLSSLFGSFTRQEGASQSLSKDRGFHRNELLLGTEDFLFCLLIPLIGMVCVGVCTILHCVMVCFTRALGLLFGSISRGSLSKARAIRQPRPFPISLLFFTSPRRMFFSAVVLFLVSTVIPYQFAYVVACLVQMFTVICAFRTNTKLASVDSQNFYHYAHSILLLMMWVLPINLPILAVWARNLAVHWLTPFPSHHNVFCIIPFMLLVENLTAGSMVPRMRSWHRHVTNLLLVGTAFCVALYGVSHAYALHYLVNAVAAWLVYLHSTKHA